MSECFFCEYVCVCDIYMYPCRLDPELKDQLVEVIEKLLKDQTTVSVV